MHEFWENEIYNVNMWYGVQCDKLESLEVRVMHIFVEGCIVLYMRVYISVYVCVRERGRGGGEDTLPPSPSFHLTLSLSLLLSQSHTPPLKISPLYLKSTRINHQSITHLWYGAGNSLVGAWRGHAWWVSALGSLGLGESLGFVQNPWGRDFSPSLCVYVLIWSLNLVFDCCIWAWVKICQSCKSRTKNPDEFRNPLFA